MQKKLLYDVLLIRIILIFLLIIYHSFAIYNGGWKPLDNFPKIELYTWIADISYSFMLEMFVFISGLILGFQVLYKSSEFIKKSSFLKKKAHRLLIPSILFSTLYVLIIDDEINWFSIYKILNGHAHMWFLPMLFLCFCYIYIINKLNLAGKWLTILIFLMALQPLPRLPFQTYISFYYFFFFYLGFLIGNRKFCIEKYINWRSVTILFMLYIISLYTLHILKYDVVIEKSSINKLIIIYLKRINIILCSICGIFTLYISLKILTIRSNFTLHEIFIKISGYCFGVYLLQQFILKLLYDDHYYVSFLGPYLLPIVSFFVTLVISVLIVMLMLKTKVGRCLIA